MIQGRYRAWSKEVWEAVVVDMKWEDYATPGAKRGGIVPTAEQVEKARQKGWVLVGNLATARGGGSLKDLAEAITGNGDDWNLLDPRDVPEIPGPEVVVNILPLLKKAGSVETKPPLPGLSPSAGQIARARDKGWVLVGNLATAKGGGSLMDLAEAITGNGADWMLLDPRDVPEQPEGQTVVNTLPLLKKAAGKTGEREKGQDLGIFLITVYNIARESDHPALPARQARGLGRQYSESFLKDVRMQGSGVDNDGRWIQIDWMSPVVNGERGFKYVDAIRTASGRPLVPDVSVAADPAVIPLGTWVYIDTIGWRQASDTGGRIKGNHIDLFRNVPRAEAYRGVGRNPYLRVWRAK
jgi:hypothetical protein